MINSGKNIKNNERKTGWARKLFTGLMIIVSVAFAVVAMASALDLPPVVSITATQSSAVTYTITSVATDLSHTGIVWNKIYENGVLAKSCPGATCVYVAVHDHPGAWSYKSNASDGNGRVSNSNTVIVQVPDFPPILNPIGNFSVNVSELLTFNISGFDFEEGSNLTYSASGVPSGAVFDTATRTFTWIPGSGQLGIWFVNFTVSDSNASTSEMVMINVTDGIPPRYFNLTQISGPVDYSTGVHEFNSTWTDNVAVDRVWIEFDGTNHSVARSSGTAQNGVYSFNISGLGIGQHNFTWFANDTSGNMNSTLGALGVNSNFTIVRAPTTTNVVANPSSPITYGMTSNFSCINSGNLASILYINGVNANAEAGLDIVRAAGNYTINCTALENENYTGSSDQINYTINKAVPVLNSSVTSPINYTTASDYVANESNGGDGDLTYALLRNDIQIGFGGNVADNTVLGAGTYVYNYTTAGGENYTSAERVDILVVNRADPLVIGSPVLNITFNPSNGVAWGTTTTTNGIGCPSQIVCGLFRNDVLVSNPDVAMLPAGVYNYVYNTTGNENYTSASVSAVLTVGKISPDLHLYIDSVESDKNVTYNATTNTSAVSGTSVVQLYRNGALVSNTDNVILGAGNYNYTAYALENENYSSASITRLIVVNRSTSQCFITSNSPQTYPNPSNVSASCTNFEAVPQLLRNGVDVSSENSLNVVLGAGTWTYNVSVPQTENYTAAENSTFMVVNKGTPVMTYFLNGAVANAVLTYNQTLNASVYTTAGTANIFRNNIDVTSENGLNVVLPTGVWNYVFNVTGNENYTNVPSQSLTASVNVGAAQLSLVFDKTSPQNYGNAINATCSIVAGQGSITLTRNGVDVTAENGLDVSPGAGTWTYNCTLPANGNYSSAENVSTFVINPIQMPIHLYVNGVEANRTLPYGTSLSVSGVKDFAEGSLVLYRDGTSVANPENVVLGAGFYNYTLDFAATQNYTANSKTFFVNVTQADPTNGTNPSGVSLGLSILPSGNVTYGNTTNVTGFGCPSELTCTLYRNGTVVSNSDIAVLGAGFYNYTYSTPGNVNYTAGSVSGNLTVNRAVPAMSYLINGANANFTSNEPVQINASVYTTAGTANIFRNGVDVSAENGLNVTLGLGSYLYSFNVTGNENYTNVPSEFLTVNVIDTVSPLIWFESNTAASGNQTANSIAVNASASDLHLGGIVLRIYNESGLYDSSICAGSNCFDNFTGLADGIYWFNASAIDSSGNNASTETRMITVDSTIPSVVGLNVTPDPIYNGQATTISVNASDVHLDRVIAEITLPDGSFENLTLSGVGGVYSFVYGNSAQNGTYNVRIIANDTFGNVNASENLDFTVLYGVRTITNSNIFGEFYPNNFTFEVRTTNVTNSTISDSTISGPAVNISDSIIHNSNLVNVTVISFCQVYDSTVVGGTCDHVYIDPSDVRNSTTTGSRVINSVVWNSNATYSHIENSTVDRVLVDNSNVTNSTLNLVSINESSIVENSKLENLTAINSILRDTTLRENLNITVVGATIIGDTVYNGTFNYNGVTVNLTAIGSRTLPYLINFAPQVVVITPSSAVITNAYIFDGVFFDASGSTDPNLNSTGNIALTFTESLNYSYDFGDGTSYFGNESNVTHAYSHSGLYLASVTVTDVFGKSSNSGEIKIQVNERPSGGGGGGSTKCYTNWTCTNWTTVCSNGILTRVCSKTEARCLTNELRPVEAIPCTDEGSKNETSGGVIDTITGAVSGVVDNTTARTALIFLLVILAAGGILWLLKRKKSEKKTRKSRRK